MEFQEFLHFQWIIKHFMKFNEFPVPAWGYWFFIFHEFHKFLEFSEFSWKFRIFIFLQKNENLSKNHTFSPDGENSSISLGFSTFRAWIFMKVQLFAKLHHFHLNQLFHPKYLFTKGALFALFRLASDIFRKRAKLPSKNVGLEQHFQPWAEMERKSALFHKFQTFY